MRWAVLACVFAAATAAEDERVQKAFPVLTQEAADDKPFVLDGRVSGFWFRLVMRSATEGSLVVGTLHDGCPFFVADGRRLLFHDAHRGQLVDYKDVGFFFTIKAQGDEFKWSFGIEDGDTPARVDVDIPSLFANLAELRVDGTEFFGSTSKGGVLYADKNGRAILVGSPPRRTRMDLRWTWKEGVRVVVPAVEEALTAGKIQDLRDRMRSSLATLNALFRPDKRRGLEQALNKKLDWDTMETRYRVLTTVLKDHFDSGPVTGALRVARKLANREDAVPLLETAARNGDVQASAMLGAHYVAKRQFKRAIECLTPAARAEHGKAQVWLGYAYSGLKKRKLALSWFRRALAHGSKEAQLFIAISYENGVGVEPDPAKAEEFYRLAAKQGHAVAQNRLAILIEKRDPREAADWFKAAAEQAEAAYRIGYASRVKDPAKAVPWLEVAARAGIARAQALLATLYARGRGADQDFVRGYAWAILAVENGETKLTRVRDLIGQKLTAAQVAEANTLVNTLRGRR